MRRAAAFRGQPLLLLGGLLLCWTTLRVVMWQTPWGEPLEAGPQDVAATPRRVAVASPDDVLATSLRSIEVPAGPAATDKSPRVPLRMRGLPVSLDIPSEGFELAGRYPPAPPPGVPRAAPPIVPAIPRASEPNRANRWSADAWLMLRRDGAAPVTSGPPSYGRSQAGGVLRYDLAPASGVRPLAYLRASAALAGAQEREFATGLSARPLSGLPIRIAAEARVTETAFGTSLRPAVYAVTELPRFDLPLDARGEAYLQGGYVAGKHATAFVDGQVRLEKPLTRIGKAQIGAGVNAAGGAQEGAARVDVGPAISATFAVGDAHARLTADYRFRIAGDAVPASGPALTLSAGF